MAVGIVITNIGKAHWVDVMDPATRSAQATVYKGDWGSGSATPALADTTITAFTPTPEARVTTTVSQQTTSTTGDTIRHVWTVTATANRTANEAAVFDAASGGNMIYRGVHALLNIETNDQVTYTFNDRVCDAALDGV